MATNCLITKLDGKVKDDTYPRVNAVAIQLRNGTGEEKIFSFRAAGVKASIISGDGILTNSDGTIEYGTVIEECAATTLHVVTNVTSVLLLENLHLLTDFRTFTYPEVDDPPYNSKLDWVFDIRELVQSAPTLTWLSCGQPAIALSGSGSPCYGDVTNLKINATGRIQISGCSKLSGSMDSIIRNMPQSAERIAFTGTALTYKASSLRGDDGEHKNLKFYPSVHVDSTDNDIKYFGDTANKSIYLSAISGYNKFTGSIEDLIERAVLNGRTVADGSSDCFAVQIKSSSGSYFTGVTFRNQALSSYYNDPANTNHYNHIKFMWDGTDPSNISITYTFVSSQVTP